MKVVSFLIFILFTLHAESAKILLVFNVAAPSHYILGNALAKGLANSNHDVTMISAFTEKNPPKNGTYRDVVLNGFTEIHDKITKEFNDVDKGIWEKIKLLDEFFYSQTERTLAHPNVQKLMNSGETFDVVIVEQFMNDALKMLAPHFGGHLIGFSTIGASSWVNALVGNTVLPSVGTELMVGSSNRMNFKQRCINTFAFVMDKLVKKFRMFPRQEYLAKQYFPNAKVDFYDVLYNASLALLNGHQSTSEAVSLVPNMIEIGGFHVQPPKALPRDLQDFMDSAKEGVVYFSLGSNFKGKNLPIEKREIFLRVLGKLKQKVLWKFEDENLPGKPDNVKIIAWAPQQDILAHPNLKLFVTHGGLLSTTETVYHGVPILAIPIGGDQVQNADTAVRNGFAVKVDFLNFSEDDLQQAIDEILDNPTYKENVKIRSKIMHDRPMKPIDAAVFWTEYVIRHQGALHLRTATLDLEWYQIILLDVLAAFISLMLLILGIFVILVKYCCCRRKSKKIETHTKPKKNGDQKKLKKN